MNPTENTLSPVDRIRALCLALPEAEEKPFGGHTAPSFRVRDKLFVTVYEDHSAMTLKDCNKNLVTYSKRRSRMPAERLFLRLWQGEIGRAHV